MALEPVLPDCGCCETDAGAATEVRNRPGLSALAYRAGTHGRFRATMLGRFATVPELRALTARGDDDPSVAVVDAWATVLDVLTFYEERIANEGFLRTATERRSVNDLAAEIGYQLRPGVAANGPLAFELETGAGSPARVDIPKGAKVQSIPGPGEVPQTFETDEAIEARPEWNRIPVRAVEPTVLNPRDRETWLAGTATNLRRGDIVLLVGRERDENPESDRWDVRQLTAVEPDQARGSTRIAWDRGLGWRGAGHFVHPAASDVRCFAFRQRAALFGAAAPDWGTLSATVRAKIAGRETTREDWPNLYLRDIAADQDEPDRTIFLDAIYPRVVAGSWIALQRPGYVELYRPDDRLGASAIADDARTGFTLSAKTTRVVVEGENLHEVFNSHVRDTVVLIDGEELALAATPIVEPVEGRTVVVDDPLEGFASGRTVIVSGPRARLVVAEGAHPTLTTDDGPVRLAPRDVLTVTGVSTTSGATRTWPVLTAAGVVGIVSIPAGDTDIVPVPAPPDAEIAAEARIVELVSPVSGEPDQATIEFTEPLSIAFDRDATVVLANVAPATHGETKQEVLGSGDGSAAYQSFALKQKPLTFVPAAATGGAASTLRVDIDGVTWAPAPGLDGLGPRDRSYVTRIDDDLTATVAFGDGRLGARLPTGIENVGATYRVGIGAGGNLNANQLSLLMTRPLGTRGVTNPLPTAGGTEPESRDGARTNAPRTVLTFDRVVSLDDAATFATSFARIAKSDAVWVWEGRRRVILLTVAGEGGATVATVPTIHDLAAQIHDKSDGHLAVRILPHESLTFNVDAGIFLDEGYDEARVLAEVRSRLVDQFSFERRDLAQRVSVSEVGAAIQAVRGVLAVDLDADGIWITGKARPTEPVLRARRGRRGRYGLEAAQVLTINTAPGGIVIARRS